jgi:multiple sugar transport system permease protein
MAAAGFSLRHRVALTGWGLLAPALIVLLVMSVVPTVYLVMFAFQHVDLLGPGTKFIGLQNFVRVLSDPEIWSDAGATALYVALAVSIQIVLGLALALMLNRKLPETELLTALFILPLGVAPVVSALIFRELLNPVYGWVDFYFQSWGLMGDAVDWLANPLTAWISIIALDVWQWTPFVALILLAGLQGVPQEPREAAVVDGAGPFGLFWHITLPLIRPFIAIALVLRAIEAFKTFAGVFVLTGGGPGTSTTLLTLDMYRIALQDFDVGAAAALGLCFLFALSFVMSRLLAVLAKTTDILEE